MFVGRLRRRAADRRPSRAGRIITGAVCAAALTGCAAVEDAIESSDSDVTVEETTTTAPVFDPDVYCELSHDADRLNASFTEFDDPAALEGFIGELVTLLTEATPPPGIEAEFIVFRRAYVDLQAQLAASGFDSAVLSSSPILSDANVNAALEAVDQHDDALCGPAPGLSPPETDGGETAGGDDAGDDAGDTDPFAEAIATGDFSVMEEILRTEIGRQAFIEGFTQTSPGVTEEQAGCFLDSTDIAVLAEMSVDPDDLSDEAVAGFLATLEICDIPLSAFQTE